MTNPTPDPLAEALHDAGNASFCWYECDGDHSYQSDELRATLAARGVYLVTEESLARALPKAYVSTGWPERKADLRAFAAAILRSLGETSDD